MFELLNLSSHLLVVSTAQDILLPSQRTEAAVELVSQLTELSQKTILSLDTLIQQASIAPKLVRAAELPDYSLIEVLCSLLEGPLAICFLPLCSYGATIAA